MPELLELLDAVVAQTAKLITACRPPASFRLGVGDVQVEVRWPVEAATAMESHAAGPLDGPQAIRSS
ncbi:MAG TPA: hypothetical protein VFU36_01155 [Jatrophihabitans sp.]|nr:hypothetical protein [Jatrophihabitans sp.]